MMNANYAFQSESLILRINNLSCEDIEDLLPPILEAQERFKTSLLSYPRYSQLQMPDVSNHLGIEQRKFISYYQHELNHLHYHLGTSYGLFIHSFHSSFARLMTLLCAHHANENESWLPFIASENMDMSAKKRNRRRGIDLSPSLGLDIIMEEYHSKPTEEMHEWEHALVEWMGLTDAIHCLNGTVGQYDKLQPWIGFVRHDIGVRLRENVPTSLQPCACSYEPWPRDPLLRAYYCVTSPFCPQVGGELLGANQLLEAMAVGHQINICRDLQIEKEMSTELQNIYESSAYATVMETWLRFFYDNPYQLNLKDVIFPIEFRLIVELALWMPVTPWGYVNGSNEIDWHDIHPGWRFLKICSYLSKKGWQPNGTEAGSSAYRGAFMEEICQALGWPTIGFLAQTWLQFLETSLQDGHSYHYFCENGFHHPRIEATCAKMQEVLIDYGYIQPSISLPSYRHIEFTGILVDDAFLSLVANDSAWIEWISKGNEPLQSLYLTTFIRNLCDDNHSYDPAHNSMVQQDYKKIISHIISYIGYREPYLYGTQAYTPIDLQLLGNHCMKRLSTLVD